MKTRCKNCMKLIGFGNRYCENCKKISIKNKSLKDRTKEADSFLKTATWRAIRKKVLLRDKCCVLCFKRGYIEVRTLQVHHIFKRVDDVKGEKIYDPENLVTVCRVCHEELEKLPIYKQKEILGEYNKEVYDFRL